ncbi:MAG: esterase-like activity of phytase family protein [Nocardioidaceae bacterium]
MAASVIAATKTDPGRVVFLDATGTVLGSLVRRRPARHADLHARRRPHPRGQRGRGRHDLRPDQHQPGGLGQHHHPEPRQTSGASTVQTAGFTAFNAQRAALLASGVRIFAAAPSVAQDLEPEYYRHRPRRRDRAGHAPGGERRGDRRHRHGHRDRDPAPRPEGLRPRLDVPRDLHLREPADDRHHGRGPGDPLGGFSGLVYEGVNLANGNLRFLTHTDRGPNAEPVDVDADPAVERPFALPGFQPELVRFELDRRTGALTITGRIGLTRQDGTPLTGLPNLRTSTSDNAAFNDEEPIDLFGNPLAARPARGRPRGIAVAADGTLWAVDEYRPAIYHFDATGRLIERIVPQGTAAAAGQPAGTFGTEALPAVLGRRRANRGFEAVAIQDGRIYAFVQSTIRNPTTLTNGNLNALRNVRIVEYNPANGQTRQFLYVQDAGSDKIGDAAALGSGEFLVIERDDDSVLTAGSPAIDKKVYRFNLAGATDVSALNDPIDGLTIDQMTPAQLAAAGVVPVAETLRVDLAAAGYNRVEKVEGLAVIDAETIVVINDDDFGLEGTFDRTTGRLTTNPSPEPILLGIINIQSNGLDASDQDGGIRHPARAGLRPVHARRDRLVLQQRSDLLHHRQRGRHPGRGAAGSAHRASRRWTRRPTPTRRRCGGRRPRPAERLAPGRRPRRRRRHRPPDRLRRAVVLDPRRHRPPRVRQRRPAREAHGRARPEPVQRQRRRPQARFDTRSDDKGPEPESVAVGAIDGRIYAFIALERGPGGVIVFDVTVPADPEFVGLFGRAGDVGPEGITFVSAADSPNGRPLLIVANEVSNTVTLYQGARRDGRQRRARARPATASAVDEDAVLSVPRAGRPGQRPRPRRRRPDRRARGRPDWRTLALAADGSFVYTPRPNFERRPLHLRASDGSAALGRGHRDPHGHPGGQRPAGGRRRRLRDGRRLRAGRRPRAPRQRLRPRRRPDLGRGPVPAGQRDGRGRHRRLLHLPARSPGSSGRTPSPIGPRRRASRRTSRP